MASNGTPQSYLSSVRNTNDNNRDRSMEQSSTPSGNPYGYMPQGNYVPDNRYIPPTFNPNNGQWNTNGLTYALPQAYNGNQPVQRGGFVPNFNFSWNGGGGQPTQAQQPPTQNPAPAPATPPMAATGTPPPATGTQIPAINQAVQNAQTLQAQNANQQGLAANPAARGYLPQMNGTQIPVQQLMQNLAMAQGQGQPSPITSGNGLSTGMARYLPYLNR